MSVNLFSVAVGIILAGFSVIRSQIRWKEEYRKFHAASINTETASLYARELPDAPTLRPEWYRIHFQAFLGFPRTALNRIQKNEEDLANVIIIVGGIIPIAVGLVVLGLMSTLVGWFTFGSTVFFGSLYIFIVNRNVKRFHRIRETRLLRPSVVEYSVPDESMIAIQAIQQVLQEEIVLARYNVLNSDGNEATMMGFEWKAAVANAKGEDESAAWAPPSIEAITSMLLSMDIIRMSLSGRDQVLDVSKFFMMVAALNEQ